jgi:hypothetical protein
MKPFRAKFIGNYHSRSNNGKEFKGIVVQITNEENSSDAGSEDNVWYIDNDTQRLQHVQAYQYDIYFISFVD